MSISKADFDALKATMTTTQSRLTVLEAENSVLKAQIAELKVTPVSKKGKGGSTKAVPTAAQVKSKEVSKAWNQYCLEHYTAEYSEAYKTLEDDCKKADDDKKAETGTNRTLLPLMKSRHAKSFASSMQKVHASDYAAWRALHAPASALVEEESAAEGSAAESDAAPPAEEVKKPKASPKPKTSVKSKATPAPEEEHVEEPVAVPASAGSRKVIPKSKAAK